MNSEMIYASNRDTEVRPGAQHFTLGDGAKAGASNKRYDRNPSRHETQLPSDGATFKKRPSETDMVVMEFGDLEERKKSRRSRHQTGQKISEEDEHSSDELSLADIDMHL